MAGRKSRWRPEMTEMAKTQSEKGVTIKEAIAAMGLTRGQFSYYRLQHEDFRTASQPLVDRSKAEWSRRKQYITFKGYHGRAAADQMFPEFAGNQRMPPTKTTLEGGVKTN